jgi:ADP-dependent NAD(P)H-hydrate dehydratase / NAD(P)H-hydrate epimerase
MKPFTAILSGDHHVLQPILRAPRAVAHKYDRGHAVVISGPALATGASRLAALAALRVGAGLVTIVGDEAALAEQAGQVTAIMLKLRDQEFTAIDHRVRSIAIGPAAGIGQETRDAVLTLLSRNIPLVMDADALTSFEHFTTLLFNASYKNVILTPHQGEFARLFPAIQVSDRISAAKAAARFANAVVLLKGASTVIAAPDGRYAINLHSAPWLATAGSGDVLTGILCGLLAQGVEPFDAACIGAWLHGDIAVRYGPGLISDEMPNHLPMVLRGCLAT